MLVITLSLYPSSPPYDIQLYMHVCMHYCLPHVMIAYSLFIQRCPLESLVLSVKTLDIGGPRSILRLALEPPHLSDIEKTILNLKEVRTRDMDCT